MNHFLIIGGGGHAKVVIDAVLKAHPNIKISVFDDDEKKHGTRILNVLIEPPNLNVTLLSKGIEACIAIGDNLTRIQKYLFWKELGLKFRTVIHPDSLISPFAKIGDGTVVFAGAVINPEAWIGDNVIVNTGSVIEHDCVLENHVQVATNATLCGGVKVREGAMIGAGATILPGVEIGRYAVVGAGAVVISSIPDKQTYVGVPARAL